MDKRRSNTGRFDESAKKQRLNEFPPFVTYAKKNFSSHMLLAFQAMYLNNENCDLTLVDKTETVRYVKCR